LNNLVGNISTASLGRAVTKAVVEVGILAQARVVIVRASKLGVLAGHVGDAKVAAVVVHGLGSHNGSTCDGEEESGDGLHFVE